jgi:hypothetical protein
MERKKRNPLNEDNPEFKITLSKFDTKRVVEVMKYVGATSRPSFLKMCVELGIRHYGEK